MRENGGMFGANVVELFFFWFLFLFISAHCYPVVYILNFVLIASSRQKREQYLRTNT